MGGKGSVVIEAAGVMTRDRIMVRDGDDGNGAVGIHMNALSSIGRQHDHVKVDASSTNDQHSEHTENTNNPLLRAASNDSADGTASDRSTTNLMVSNSNQHWSTSVNHNSKPSIKIKPPPSV